MSAVKVTIDREALYRAAVRAAEAARRREAMKTEDGRRRLLHPELRKEAGV